MAHPALRRAYMRRLQSGSWPLRGRADRGKSSLRAAANQFCLRFYPIRWHLKPVTEELTQRVLDTINREAGPGNVARTLGFDGYPGFSLSD